MSARLTLRVSPGAARSVVEIVSGRSSRDKTVALEGIRPEEMERRLAEASGAGEEPK
jgi:uncharacterized protein YggU (UPF0235/DUF167 family)